MDLEYMKYMSSGYDKNKILHLLMVQYGQDVWNFAFSLTRQRNLADDIRQDVFVKVFDKLDTFRAQSSVKTWLFSITRNLAVDYRRSAFIRKVTLVDYIRDRGSRHSAENEYFEKRDLNEAWKAVLSLPIKLREVITLFAHHQLSIAEIAVTLQISESAVKVRLHRARKQVNEKYKGREDAFYGEK
ncbi:sigma-70 family RNA polymerase sigma factor [Cohnella sp. WQ 127256]|uniref:sigma-70 family RNA polymerase sigma factor n=1 Tax=Cohnella sp. WQ 127256 TaxID=2938790 RepID=UPI002118EB6D|nr:sigma-70 family RNA polymerase sigma factor [Cohnella sp. WQ 127256]